MPSVVVAAAAVMSSYSLSYVLQRGTPDCVWEEIVHLKLIVNPVMTWAVSLLLLLLVVVMLLVATPLLEPVMQL